MALVKNAIKINLILNAECFDLSFAWMNENANFYNIFKDYFFFRNVTDKESIFEPTNWISVLDSYLGCKSYCLFLPGHAISRGRKTLFENTLWNIQIRPTIIQKLYWLNMADLKNSKIMVLWLDLMIMKNSEKDIIFCWFP